MKWKQWPFPLKLIIGTACSYNEYFTKIPTQNWQIFNLSVAHMFVPSLYGVRLALACLTCQLVVRWWSAERCSEKALERVTGNSKATATKAALKTTARTATNNSKDSYDQQQRTEDSKFKYNAPANNSSLVTPKRESASIWAIRNSRQLVLPEARCDFFVKMQFRRRLRRNLSQEGTLRWRLVVRRWDEDT